MKTVFATLFFALLMGSFFGQDDYIVQNNRDTIYGTITLNVENKKETFWKEVVFENDKGAVKTYDSKWIKAYNYNGEDYEIFDYNGKKQFFRWKEKNEGISLLESFFDKGNGLGNVVEFIKKSHEPFPFYVNPAGFKKTVANYFSDCKIVADKIEDKELRYQDMPHIIRTYNTWYNDPKVKKKRKKKR